MDLKIDPELKEEMVIWTLVLEKIASLEELEKLWSYDDVLRVLAAMKIKFDKQEKEIKAQHVNRKITPNKGRIP